MKNQYPLTRAALITCGCSPTSFLPLLGGMAFLLLAPSVLTGQGLPVVQVEGGSITGMLIGTPTPTWSWTDTRTPTPTSWTR